MIPALILGFNSRAASFQVWTSAKTEHVLRSETLPEPSAVKLAAARNEWESFQILVRADEPMTIHSVDVGNLKNSNGAILEKRHARVYREHQLFVETGSYRNTAFKKDWYPDALIPADAPEAAPDGAKPNLRALPFALAANETHAFWIDLYIPPDSLPGVYHGTCLLTADRFVKEIPIELTIWNFALPSTPALQTAFGSPAPRLRDYLRRVNPLVAPQIQATRETEARIAQLLSEHRLNATPPPELLRPVLQADGSFKIPLEQVQKLREFIDRYHVNALETPHPSSAIRDPEVDRDKFGAWLAAFDAAATELQRPHVMFFTYLKDEPNTEADYRYVQKWGRAIRDARSVVKVLVVEQPWTAPGQGGADSAWGDLFGAVDIWCPLFSLHRPDKAAERQALGEIVWTYTALCQGPPTPWWQIDFPLLNYRVPAWMAWGDHMRGLLYWGGLSYWGKTNDPWIHAPFYSGNGEFQQGKKGIVFNGEGSLVYPARELGLDGVVPTIRLKALRDGIEDYEYLALLERIGKRAEAEKIVRGLAESFFKWNPDPAAYEKARVQLARLIDSSRD